jgi:hypothetical protein
MGEFSPLTQDTNFQLVPTRENPGSPLSQKGFNDTMAECQRVQDKLSVEM